MNAVDFTDDALDTIKTLDKVNGATKSSLSAGRRFIMDTRQVMIFSMA